MELIDGCLVPAEKRRPLYGARWWDDEALWDGEAVSTVMRPTEEEAFQIIRLQCRNFTAALYAKYTEVSMQAIRDEVTNRRASYDAMELSPVERDAIWGRPRRWLYEVKRGVGSWILNPDWSERVTA